MRKPLVAIIGRPNVGKSSFFNYISGQRISITDSTPGVTRDRIYADAEWSGYFFTLVDTGGLDSKSSDIFQKDIFEQAQLAIEFADVIIFMVDGKDGITNSDKEIADFLRRSNKNIVLVVNKLDNFEVENTYEFYELDLGVPHPISVMQAKGLGEVLDEVVSFLSKNTGIMEDDSIKIAVVGRPNVGKSSIVNRILGEDRVLVSEIAGTTRDAIDSKFKYEKKEYTIVDTAGLRRKRAYDTDSIEHYSVLRSIEAIKRADIVLIVFDSSQEISEQDVRIAGLVHEENKPSIVIMNKWDIPEKDEKTINKYNKILEEKLKFMSYFKVLYISAKTGKRFGEIMPEINKVLENNSRRITTGILNELLANAILENEPPFRKNRRLKIKYITQSGIKPPTFVLFVNEAELLHFSYIRYLENYIRNAVDFSGTPIKFVIRGRKG
jgi:GTP-binding protein